MVENERGNREEGGVAEVEIQVVVGVVVRIREEAEEGCQETQAVVVAAVGMAEMFEEIQAVEVEGFR